MTNIIMNRNLNVHRHSSPDSRFVSSETLVMTETPLHSVQPVGQIILCILQDKRIVLQPDFRVHLKLLGRFIKASIHNYVGHDSYKQNNNTLKLFYLQDLFHALF